MSCLLIVDDEPLNLEIIADFLDGQGHELTMAQDGLQAWTLLETAPDRFDAVILDRLMPQMDGMEVLRRLQADARFEALPIIMQTAASEPAQVAEGLATGAWYYLAKPYDGTALNSIVRAALENRRHRQELTRLGQEMQELLAMAQEVQFRFRSPQEARLLAAALAQLCPNAGSVAMGLSELLLNAVEHGNLGISYQDKSSLLESDTWEAEVARRLASPEQADRWATLEFRRDADHLHFTIRDQGEGFDWRNYLELDPARAFDSHGRGIAMARMLAFASLEYLERGNVARARVAIGEAV